MGEERQADDGKDERPEESHLYSLQKRKRRHLRRGFAPEEVAHWLGVDPQVMERYQRVITSPIDVV